MPVDSSLEIGSWWCFRGTKERARVRCDVLTYPMVTAGGRGVANHHVALRAVLKYAGAPAFRSDNGTAGQSTPDQGLGQQATTELSVAPGSNIVTIQELSTYSPTQLDRDLVATTPDQNGLAGPLRGHPDAKRSGQHR